MTFQFAHITVRYTARSSEQNRIRTRDLTIKGARKGDRPERDLPHLSIVT